MNVQHNKYNQHCCMLYVKVVKRVNPKSSDHKKFFLNSFNFISIGDNGYSPNYCNNNIAMNIHQIITLYILNFYTTICQSYFSKTERK